MLSGHPEMGILKGGEQEHQVPVMERSSPARLNLPLTQGERQDSSYTRVLFQTEILLKSNSMNFGKWQNMCILNLIVSDSEVILC